MLFSERERGINMLFGPKYRPGGWYLQQRKLLHIKIIYWSFFVNYKIYLSKAVELRPTENNFTIAIFWKVLPTHLWTERKSKFLQNDSSSTYGSRPCDQARSIVVEPKLFVSTPAPAPTFKNFRLRSRLQLQLCIYLFAQLLGWKVDF